MSNIPPDTLELIERYARIASNSDTEIADELADHLLCEISSAISAGEDPTDAFLRVSTHFGHPAEIAEAFAEQQRDKQSSRIKPMTLNQRSALLISHSLVWAAVILATSAIVADTSTGSSVMFILLAGWFATFFPLQAMIGGGRAAACAEWAWMKRTAQRVLPVSKDK
ncbi:MAG: hypothetical protein NXH85_16090 [Pseudomonadaceae bacterium]|nr:hypothetical protein [Pseudomonadaceae bacterium]